MQRSTKLIILIAGIFLVLGCSIASVEVPVPIPIGETAPTATPAPENVKITGYNFQSKDAGAGWKEGTVQLAFENDSEKLVAGKRIPVESISVSAGDSMSYTVSLYRMDTTGEVKVDVVDFSQIPQVIPAHYRWTRVGLSGEKSGEKVVGGYYFLRFRYATTATPKTITFGKPTEWSIELGSAPKTLVFPTDTNIQQIGQLNYELSQPGQDVVVKLDGAGQQVGQRLELKYTVTNNDKTQFRSTPITFSVAALYFGDGAISPRPMVSFSQSAGANPGQKSPGTINLGIVFLDSVCNRQVYGLIENKDQPAPNGDTKPDKTYTLYQLNVCR